MIPIITLVCAIMLLGSGCRISAQGISSFDHFISADKGKLFDGEREIRFVSCNIPNLHYIEDQLPFLETNPWRLPDEFEIRDALTSIQQMGGQVVRTYTLSVRKADDDVNIPRHILAPGQLYEPAFVALDKVLQTANELGIRLIIPFIDNWSWWGGVAEFAGFRGQKKESFWNDPQIIADFEQTINMVLNRVNSCTGVAYKNDKAILAWETGNELTCPPEWTAEIAAYIKSIDQNHLLLDGFHSQSLRENSLADPHIDLVTTHHYEKNAEQMVRHIQENIVKASERKPYVVGEFGFIDTPGVEQVLNLVVDSPCSGALIWSLRFHSRDGGFYWHSEPYGGNLFKAYHWPGFDSGDPFDERGCLHLLRQKAFAIQGIEPPALQSPAPPFLLPMATAAGISWQGSAGAAVYDVERAESHQESWQTIGRAISDADYPYRPLYADDKIELGKSYFYRVIAVNQAGRSAPSNIVQAPPASRFTLIDECADWRFVSERSDKMVIVNDEARKSKEDFHRFRAAAGDHLVYHSSGAMTAVRLYSFFPQRAADLIVMTSSDGRDYHRLQMDVVNPLTRADAYEYYQPLLFSSAKIGADITYLKIEFPVATELSRVEIEYDK